MDGVGSDPIYNPLVIGATNVPWAIDAGIVRWFVSRIYIPLPDLPARIYLIKNLLEKDKKFLGDKV